jgi:hypothetical protein
VKASYLIQYLKQTLPNYTTLFSDVLSITSLTYSGGLVTATTAVPHGLTTGNYVLINGALTPIDILSITNDGHGTAHATTVHGQWHDFTNVWSTQCQIIGADQFEYNGIHNLTYANINRENFTYAITGTPVSPATGIIKLLTNIAYGYNGTHQITVTDATHFTYPLSVAVGSPAQGTITLQKNIRISGAISYERAIPESYTKQSANNNWMFVVIGDHSASRDLNSLEEAYRTAARANELRTQVTQPFSLYVVIPTSNDLTAITQRDAMEDLARLIIKTVWNLSIPSGYTDNETLLINFVSHGFIDYNHAYYVHEFKFEYVYYLTYDDGVLPDGGVAFRDIFLNTLNDNGVQTSTAYINLDDQPLT